MGARFRIRNRAAVGRDAAQPADLEDTVGWKVANPLLQDELRRIGKFGAHGLRIAGFTIHLEQHLLETPTLPPPGLPVHGGFVRVGAFALEVDVVDQRIKIFGGANDARELDDDMFALRAVGRCVWRNREVVVAARCRRVPGRVSKRLPPSCGR